MAELTEWERQQNHDLANIERGYRLAISRVMQATAEAERDDKVFSPDLIDVIVGRVFQRGVDEFERRKRKADDR